MTVLDSLPQDNQQAALDHLVIAARTLEEGAQWLRERLGLSREQLAAGPVGVHPHFGTHNLLWSLGSSYLEVIAVNTQAPAPPYPRWFGLDTTCMQARLEAGPALIHWVAQTGAAPLPVQGEPLALSRGAYRWTLTVPANGSLPAGGLLPSLIAWQGPSPLANLPDVGLRLQRLHLLTPQPTELQSPLRELHLSELVTVQAAPQPRLRALIEVGGKLRELS